MELRSINADDSPDESETILVSPPVSPAKSLSPSPAHQHQSQHHLNEDYLYLLHHEEIADWAASSTTEERYATLTGYGTVSQSGDDLAAIATGGGAEGGGATGSRANGGRVTGKFGKYTKMAKHKP